MCLAYIAQKISNIFFQNNWYWIICHGTPDDLSRHTNVPKHIGWESLLLYRGETQECPSPAQLQSAREPASLKRTATRAPAVCEGEPDDILYCTNFSILQTNSSSFTVTEKSSHIAIASICSQRADYQGPRLGLPLKSRCTQSLWPCQNYGTVTIPVCCLKWHHN